MVRFSLKRPFFSESFWGGAAGPPFRKNGLKDTILSLSKKSENREISPQKTIRKVVSFFRAQNGFFCQKRVKHSPVCKTGMVFESRHECWVFQND